MPGHLKTQYSAIKFDRAIDVAHVDTDMADAAEMNAQSVPLG